MKFTRVAYFSLQSKLSQILSNVFQMLLSMSDQQILVNQHLSGINFCGDSLFNTLFQQCLLQETFVLVWATHFYLLSDLIEYKIKPSDRWQLEKVRNCQHCIMVKILTPNHSAFNTFRQGHTLIGHLTLRIYIQFLKTVLRYLMIFS